MKLCLAIRMRLTEEFMARAMKSTTSGRLLPQCSCHFCGSAVRLPVADRLGSDHELDTDLRRKGGLTGNLLPDGHSI